MVLYLIRNTQTGRQYVGVTRRTLRARWNDHLSAAYGKFLKSPLYGDMRIFGREAFECICLKEVDDHDELMALEVTTIHDLGTLYPQGYNLAKGGHVNYGWRHSPETKQRLAEAKRGTTASAETRQRMSARHKGRKFSASTLEKMSRWQVGRVMSDEARAKMSKAKLGKPWSEKRRAYWESMTPDDRAAWALKIKEGQKKD